MMQTDAPPSAADRRYASRKFLIAAAVLLANVGLLLAGAIDQAIYADSLKWIAGLYFGANVGAWAVDAVRARQ